MNGHQFQFDVISRAQSVIERFGQDCFKDEITGYIWHVEQLERSYEADFRYTKLKLTAYKILACLEIREVAMAKKLLPKLVKVAKKEQKRLWKRRKELNDDAMYEVYPDEY